MCDDLSDDEVGTAVPVVSTVGNGARVEYSRLDTRLMGNPREFRRAARSGARLEVPDMKRTLAFRGA